MIDATKVAGDNQYEIDPVIGAVCSAREVLEQAQRNPDEKIKAPLIKAARLMLQNALDALNTWEPTEPTLPDPEDLVVDDDD